MCRALARRGRPLGEVRVGSRQFLSGGLFQKQPLGFPSLYSSEFYPTQQLLVRSNESAQSGVFVFAKNLGHVRVTGKSALVGSLDTLHDTFGLPGV